MDRMSRFTPLGLHRNRVIGCLGGNSERSPSFFATPSDDIDIFDAYREYVDGMSKRWGKEVDPFTIALLAAGRLLTGELAAADLIVDNLPAETIKLDHGAGICLVVPIYALKNALPLAASLQDTERWVQGSPEQTALRTWLEQHREELQWVESAGVYRRIE